MKASQSVEAVPASHAVVERVAALEGVDPTELVPLYEVINPEAVDKLVGTADGSGSPLAIDFRYHGHEITVTGEGVVHIDGDGTVEG